MTFLGTKITKKTKEEETNLGQGCSKSEPLKRNFNEKFLSDACVEEKNSKAKMVFVGLRSLTLTSIPAKKKFKTRQSRNVCHIS